MGEPERRQRLGEHVALGIGRLRRRPHGQPAGEVVLADNHVGFDGAVGVAGHLVGVLEHDIGRGKAGFDVAAAGLAPVGDVGVLMREEPRHPGVVGKIGVEQFGVRGDGGIRIEDGRQLLVGDLDQFGGALGDLRGAGDDGRHLLSDEADPILGEHVAVLHVDAKGEREVGTGHHLDDACERLGRCGVDPQDAGVRVGALDDLGVEKIGPEVEVIDELGRAADLVDAVDAWGSGADVGEIAHDALPPLAARAITASTIGS